MIRLILSTLFAMTILSGSAFALSEEQVVFTQARTLFEQQKYEDAIKLYDRVPAKSDRWLLAVEEKAWAHIQLKQYDKAIALAHTLTSPAFNAMTSTEVYLLRALVELKLCDYQAVFRTLKTFKVQKRSQVESLQKLAKTGRNEFSGEALTKWIENANKWQQMGPLLAHMPQLFFRDEKMVDAAAHRDMNGMTKRLQELAKMDHNENYRTLQKMNLIEIEAVQRAHIETKLADKQGEPGDRSDDELVFKHSNNDQWLDEVNSYEATVNRCQKKSGRTM